MSGCRNSSGQFARCGGGKSLGQPWPSPTTKPPSIKTMERWMNDGVAKATDGCRVEPDGVCPHGHPSWMMRLGVI